MALLAAEQLCPIELTGELWAALLAEPVGESPSVAALTARAIVTRRLADHNRFFADIERREAAAFSSSGAVDSSIEGRHGAASGAENGVSLGSTVLAAQPMDGRPASASAVVGPKDTRSLPWPPVLDDCGHECCRDDQGRIDACHVVEDYA